jgi:hypothetical protein
MGIARLLALTALAVFAVSCATTQHVGARPTTTGRPLSLAEALDDANVGKTIALYGRIAEVCQEEGCWMVVTDGTRSLRTTFKDRAFFMPKDVAGATVVAEGVLKHVTLDEATRRHYAEDAGRSAEEVSAIRGPSEEYAFVADSVTVRR